MPVVTSFRMIRDINSYADAESYPLSNSIFQALVNTSVNSYFQAPTYNNKYLIVFQYCCLTAPVNMWVSVSAANVAATIPTSDSFSEGNSMLNPYKLEVPSGYYINMACSANTYVSASCFTAPS